MNRLLFIISLFTLLLSCRSSDIQNTPPLYSVSDPQLSLLLSNAIHHAGGWDNYQRIKTIQYTKRSVLYHPDRQIESDKTERHTIHLQGAVSGSLVHIDGTDTSSINLLENGQAHKAVNGVIDTSKAAYQNFMSAYYVLLMPFKLLDPGTRLSYLGESVLDEHPVQVVKATYDPSTNENHSTADEWYFFFEPATGRYIASAVYHAPTYALIENNEQENVAGIVFNTYRKSWRVDSLFNKEYLRGEFWYSDYYVNLVNE